MNRPKTTAPPLLWNSDGRVCCPAHAPYPKSDTWERQAWRRMRAAEIAAFAARTGMPTQCEVCRVIAARGGAA